MTTAEAALTQPDPCPYCAQPTGQGCVTLVARVPTKPHGKRLVLGRVFLAGAASRQGEVDNIDSQFQAAHTEADRLTVVNFRLAFEKIGLRDNLAAEQAARTTDRDVAARLVADLRAQIAALTPKAATEFGACAVGGGSGLPVAKTVTDKWGAGTTVRMFNQGGTLTVQNDSTLGRVHTSYKPNIQAFLAGGMATLDAARAGIASARTGDVVEPWHEYDVKERKGEAPCDWATWVRFKAAWYDFAKSINPDVLVGTTVGASRFIDTAGHLSTEDMTRWKAVKGDVFGVDFDGGRQVDKYPTWTGGADDVAAFVDGSDYAYWAVPEFIHERLPSDPTGTGRAAWLTKYAQEFTEAGALYCHLFEYPSRPTNALTTPAEIAAWKALVEG